MLAWILLAAQAPEPTREARVLELLREVHEELHDVQPGCCCLVDVPIDAARARAYGRRLCAIYGLEVEADAPMVVVDGPARLVDAWDAARGIGFDLEEPPEVLASTLPVHFVPPGAHLFLRPAASFRGRTGVEAQFAFLSPLIDFLDDATGGEEVRTGALLREPTAFWRLHELGVFPTSVTHEHTRVSPYECRLVVEQRSLVRFPSDGLGSLRGVRLRPGCGTVPRPPFEEAFDREAPVLFQVMFGTRGAPPWADVRIVQPSEIGPAPRTFPVRPDWTILPRDFDLERPFTLEIDLPPGTWTLYPVAAFHVAPPRE